MEAKGGSTGSQLRKTGGFRRVRGVQGVCVCGEGGVME